MKKLLKKEKPSYKKRAKSSLTKSAFMKKLWLR